MLTDKPSCKYKIIYDTVSKYDNILTVNSLCRTAGVSRSGYYRWIATAAQRDAKAEADKNDFNIILQAFRYRGYDKGVRGIYMRLLHLNPPIIMNQKKIRRLMNKFGLKCPVRKANPYRQLARALRTNNYADNILNRQFESNGPRTVLLTDITYIPYKDGTCYLSPVMDAYTKQILAYTVSETLEVDFVLEMVKKLMEKHGHELKTETLIHSDQGFHYTSHKFMDIIRDNGIRQSMSRRGNCWDNAPQESFFGHMKDEIGTMIHKSQNYFQVKNIIDEWIDYYNNDRYVWKLSKLSPNEFYEYCLTGNYPLKHIIKTQ